MTPVPTIPAVVVGVDGSGSSTQALDWAVDEASRRRLPLHLICAWAVDYAAGAIGAVVPIIEDECRAVLQDARRRIAVAAPTAQVTSSQVQGQAAAALIAASRTADTVVVGSRGLGALGGVLAGSTSMQVATHAECPVVVVREPSTAEASLPRVIVGVDGSEVSADAIGYAFQQAAQRDLGLTVVHAWDVQFVSGVLATTTTLEAWQQLGDEERTVTAESVAGWREKYPDVEVRTHVLRGHALESLIAHSRGAELLVVGSRGRGGFRGLLLGSVSQGVLHQAHCPVAVVRPHGPKPVQ